VTRIAHLADLHFGAEDPAIVAALIDDLNTDRPDLVAISGDLTQGARYAEFRAARAFLDQLHAPWLAVPGNHDITPYRLIERFSRPYARWQATIRAETEPSWTDGAVVVFGLNTARRLGLNLDWSRGRVTRGRLARLIARLEAVPPGVARVVVAHHPLLPPEAEPETPVAGGAAAALAAMTHAHVALVLAGHLHRGYARLAAAGGQPPLVLQGGTATSVRLRGEPNAYNRVAVTASGEVMVAARVWGGHQWTTRAAGAAAAGTLTSLGGRAMGDVVAVTLQGADALSDQAPGQ
jgi:3',5'-cyclic AMP phosphodiesterase CpdA